MTEELARRLIELGGEGIHDNHGVRFGHVGATLRAITVVAYTMGARGEEDLFVKLGALNVWSGPSETVLY